LFNFLKKIIDWFGFESIIRCTNCGGIILPGDPITLREKKDGLIPKNSVVFEGKSVCCFRKKCRNGHRIDGYWTGTDVEVEFYKW